MSNPISENCSSNLHEYCTPCECVCHDKIVIELTQEEANTIVNLLMFQYIPYDNVNALVLMRRIRRFTEAINEGDI